MTTGTDLGLRAAFAKRTDLGNAVRLVSRHEELIRYVHVTQTWHIWNGHAWAPDDTGQIERYARDTVRSMQRMAEAMPKGDSDDEKDPLNAARVAAVKWATSSESAARLAAMVQLARSEEGIAVPLAAFDAATHELNCPNGIVDLRTGRLRNPDPAAMHSQRTAVRFDPKAKAPEWEKFVKTVLPDQKLRAYVHRLLGASMQGSPLPGHQFPFLFGSGGTGKSTLLETVVDVLGDYARIAPSTLLMRKGTTGSGSTYDIASLRGRRFVVVEELSGAIDDNMLKLITAAKTLAARQIREAETEFRNVTALWMASNNEPRINGSDTGLRRRIKQVVMDVVLDGPAYVGPLKAHMAAHEREGILAWLIRGAVAAERDGLVEPDVVARATDELFDSNNPVLEWLENSCIMDPDGIETGGALHSSYIDWCSRGKRRVEYRNAKSATWARALKGVGLEPVRTSTMRGYSGVRLQQPAL